MKLSANILNVTEESFGYNTAVVDRQRLFRWHEAAQHLERDNRAGWRSFYVMSGLVGILIAVLIWQRYDAQLDCGSKAPGSNAPNVMQLEPESIRAAREAPVWL